MNHGRIARGLLPWAVFSLVCGLGPSWVGDAAFLALTLALLVMVWSMDRGESVKLIEAAALPTFTAIGYSAVFAPAADGFLADYGRGIATLVLAAVLSASLATRPFTEHYARDSVPPQYRDSPRFHDVNWRVSRTWAVAVTAMSAGHLVAGALTGQSASLAVPANVLLNWVLPAGIAALAIHYTVRAARAVPTAHHISPVPDTRLPT